MAMVQALCVDGPRAGATVWMPQAATAWSTASLLGRRIHYVVTGTAAHPVHGSVVQLAFAGRSRTPLPATEVPQQRISPIRHATA